MNQESITPLAIERAGDRDVRIRWKDGQESLFPAKTLRLACPCAACVDEMTGKKLVTSDQVPDDVHPKGIGLVGRYAISILWSDNHSTGIYSFTYLRELRL
jgi:ATP-binding protein involved in chromosome partitioning